MTMREQIINLLKNEWLTNFQVQQELKSSSADREVRRVRENPPTGYKVISRKKDMPKGYNPCLEFRLVEVSNEISQ